MANFNQKNCKKEGLWDWDSGIRKWKKSSLSFQIRSVKKMFKEDKY